MDRMEAAVASGMGRGINDKILSSSLPCASCGGLRRMFQVFDNNGDAVITVKEISKALSVMGLEAEMAELDSLISLYVKPGNEGLRYEDFKALYESLVGDEEDELEQNLSDAFKVFDEDGDGYISAKELQVVLRKLGFKEGKEIDCVHRMIVSVDTNSDGLVDFCEFKHMMRNPHLLVSSSS